MNGNGYSIKNYSYTGDDEKDNVGLFSQNLGEINNLVIDRFDIYEKGSINNIGLLVGKNDGKVSGVTVKNSTLKASLCDGVGGIIANAAGIDNRTIVVKDNSNSGAITYGVNKGQYTKDFGASIVGLINDYVNNMDPSYWGTNSNTGTVYSCFTDSYIDRLYTFIK